VSFWIMVSMTLLPESLKIPVESLSSGRTVDTQEELQVAKSKCGSDCNLPEPM
jgi:hypothetical protein